MDDSCEEEDGHIPKMTKNRTKAVAENAESRALVTCAFQLARSLEIGKLLVHADELRDIRFVDTLRVAERVIWLTGHDAALPVAEKSRDVVLHLPETALTRMSQLKISLLLAVMNNHIELDESIVCLSGVAGSKRLDTLLIANARRDFPWFREHSIDEIQDIFSTRELARILDIALRLAAEGCEGKPIGTIFVLGVEDQLEPYLRQLVLNPCAGHPQRARNVHRPELFETIREFAGLDGAFIVNNRGVLQSAGTYLDAPVKKSKLRAGLGARHAAGLAITAATDALAVVVSSSSGTVTVFHEGREILELERPEPSSTQ